MAYSAIDIGAGATNRESLTSTSTYTRVDLANAANASGVLTSFEVWWNTTGIDLKLGTFSVSGTDITYHDHVFWSGNITAGSKQTYTGDNCLVTSGEYLGSSFASGTIELSDSGGSGYLYSIHERFTAGTFETTLNSGMAVSCYATGVTVPDAPTSVSATNNLSDKITITWTAGTGETDGHKVYRDGSVLNGDTAIVHGTNTFDDTTAVAGTAYAYTVKAINPAGLSAASTADNGTRTAATSFIPRIMQHNFIPPFIGGS
jgi:hypothetical protein